MKIKLLIISIAIALCLSAAPVMASPHGAGYSGGITTITRELGYFSGNGGEFTVNDAGSGSMTLSNDAYANVAMGVNGTESFQTFCVEYTEDITNPSNIHVSTANIDLSSGSHSYNGGVPGTGDDLDPMTAYLYTQFATGALASSATPYDYNPGGNRASDAEQLQDAIWFIEGEKGSLISGSKAEDWYDEAFAAVGSGGVWENMGTGGVYVMQMYGGTEDYYQDQLYYVPVTAAVLLGILGLGVAGFKLRKFA